MSRASGLSPIELPMNVETAQALAAEFLAQRKLKHLDFTMTAGTGEGQGGGTGGSGEGGQGGEGTGGNAGGAGGEGTPSGEGGAGSEGSGDPNKKIAALEEEKDRHFRAKQAAEAELQKYKDAEEEQRRKSQSEVDNLKEDLRKRDEELAKTKSDLEQARLDNAFLTDNTYQWQNSSRVLRLIDRDGIKVNEDGTISGVKEALKALAESDPYLLKSTTDDGGSSGGGSGGGTPTGGERNGRRNQNQKPSREELARKYPALRR
jgi:hypothetical protein